MKKNMPNSRNKNFPSLYDAFELGDRVKRSYKEKNGKVKEYKGIVLAIEEDSMEIYWDTLNGKYRPNDMSLAFTNCPIEEIYSGNGEYSPIKKEKN